MGIFTGNTRTLCCLAGFLIGSQDSAPFEMAFVIKQHPEPKHNPARYALLPGTAIIVSIETTIVPLCTVYNNILRS